MPGIEISNIPKTLDLQHGKHYHDLVAGRIFSQTPTPLGLLLPAYDATAICSATVCSVPIWNPSNSNVNVEVISYTVAKASGTAAFGAVYIMARLRMGADIAAGSEITAFGATTPHNGLLGAGNRSQVLSSNTGGNATVTAGVAEEAVRTLCGTGVAADLTATDLEYCHHDLDGTLIIPPGVLVWLCNTEGSGAKVCPTVVWKEIPI